MATTSEWTAYVEATTDPDPAGVGASEWTAWVEATTDDSDYLKVRRGGAWIAATGRQVRRAGAWV